MKNKKGQYVDIQTRNEKQLNKILNTFFEVLENVNKN